MPCAVADPHWTAYVSALGTPIVAALAAVFAALIAYRQWRTAQNRLKFDLFEKRLAVYKAGSELISAHVRGGGIDTSTLSNFYLATLDARWLFGRELSEFLYKEVLSPIQRNERIWERMRYSQGQNLTHLENEQDYLEHNLQSAIQRYDAKFARFLELQH